MKMDDSSWQLAEDYIVGILSEIGPNLKQEAVDTIQLYSDHGEYEMAFEGLFIEMMNLDIVQPIDLSEAYMIGQLLELDKESIFDIDFWDKFTRYIQNSTPDYPENGSTEFGN